MLSVTSEIHTFFYSEPLRYVRQKNYGIIWGFFPYVVPTSLLETPRSKIVMFFVCDFRVI